MVPVSAKMLWNKPTAMRLAFIINAHIYKGKKELFLLLKKQLNTKIK